VNIGRSTEMFTESAKADDGKNSKNKIENGIRYL
tara:strand:- start:747 stop:848 length:102 start_codon:yes stop_codon:yes gene_type:complete